MKAMRLVLSRICEHWTYGAVCKRLLIILLKKQIAKQVFIMIVTQYNIQYRNKILENSIWIFLRNENSLA